MSLRTVLMSIVVFLLFFVSCTTTETVEEMNLNEINNWLNIEVYSCQQDPLCTEKTPISGAKLSIFYFEENSALAEEDLILSAYTAANGQYICTELEGNEYYWLRVENLDSTQQTKVIRTDTNNPVREEILFP